MVKNAPGESRFNAIEHLWSHVTRQWSGVEIPRSLEGETCVPNGPNKAVHDQGINILVNLLTNKFFDSFPIYPIAHLCENERKDTLCIHEKLVNHQKFGDLLDVKKFYGQGGGTGKLDAEKKSTYAKESKLIHSHLDKRTHELIFRKCSAYLNEKVCAHCKSNPISLSKNLLDDLPSKNLGGAFWNVKKDPDHDGHFQTFKMITEKKEPFKPDEDLQLEVGRCHLQNCFYVFHSKAEKRRHLRLVHKMSTNATAEHLCQDCDSIFSSTSKLQKHKKDTGHGKAKNNKRKRQ